MINVSSNDLLGVETNDDSIISDYYFDGNVGGKINLTTNWRFYMNALIGTRYYKKFIYISRTHTFLKNGNYGVYNLTASFVNSSVSITRNYNVTKSNIFFFLIKKNHFLLIFN